MMQLLFLLPGILLGRSYVPTNVPHGDALDLLTPSNKCPLSFATICVKPINALGF